MKLEIWRECAPKPYNRRQRKIFAIPCKVPGAPGSSRELPEVPSSYGFSHFMPCDEQNKKCYLYGRNIDVCVRYTTHYGFNNASSMLELARSKLIYYIFIVFDSNLLAQKRHFYQFLHKFQTLALWKKCMIRCKPECCERFLYFLYVNNELPVHLHQFFALGVVFDSAKQAFWFFPRYLRNT